MLTKQEIIELELGNTLALSVQKRLRKMILEAKKQAGICIKSGCSCDVMPGSDLCDAHDIEKLIDSVDETTSKTFCDDSKQLFYE